MLAKLKAILVEHMADIDGMLNNHLFWLRRRRLQTELAEEMQFQLDLQFRIDSLQEHMTMSVERSTAIEAELDAAVNGGKIVTPPTKENNHAPDPRSVKKDIPEERGPRS